MIGRMSALLGTVVHLARAAGLAALLVLAGAPVGGGAAAGSRLQSGVPPSMHLVVTDDRSELARAQPLGRYGWRGGGRFAASGGRGWRGNVYLGSRPRAVVYAWAPPMRGMPGMRETRLYQMVQYGGGGRWGWRGGRGGGNGGLRGGGRGGFQAPDAAARSLRNQGYSNVDPLTRRGRSYVGEATGPMGQRQRVIIDGSSGRVMGASPLGPPVAMPPPGAGWYGGY